MKQSVFLGLQNVEIFLGCLRIKICIFPCVLRKFFKIFNHHLQILKRNFHLILFQKGHSFLRRMQFGNLSVGIGLNFKIFSFPCFEVIRSKFFSVILFVQLIITCVRLIIKIFIESILFFVVLST